LQQVKVLFDGRMDVEEVKAAGKGAAASAK
jgi:hypothetical protein